MDGLSTVSTRVNHRVSACLQRLLQIVQRLESPSDLEFRRWRCAGVVCLLGMLVACQSAPVPRILERQDRAPSSVPYDLASLPDPVPRKEPPSRYGNPRSYTVRGRTYSVMPASDGYAEEGIASWYGQKFHGRRTSSGEPFDMFKLTAAHRSLPVPTYVRVTNLSNGRATIVRVNDRGPFHDNRIIDLSYAAAVKLGFHERGTARVRVETLDDPPQFVLQAGAFVDLASADALKNRLVALTAHPSYVVTQGSDSLYRVRVGPVAGQATVRELINRIVGANLGEPIVIEQ